MQADSQSYLARIFSGCKKWELIYWWALRIPMIAAIFISAKRKDTQNVLQVCANLFGMFSWEVMMAFPAKTFFRRMPSYFQNISAAGFFLASFGGAFLNFYYVIPYYDSVLHIFGAAEACWIGYEICTAMQKRDNKVCDVAIVTLCALGMSMIFSNGWELFEFTFDQFFGGDSQHWSLELAMQAGSGVENGIFAWADRPERFALMDTMTDMVCNVVGSVAVYIFLRICPYNHKGKRDVNAMIAAQSK